MIEQIGANRIDKLVKKDNDWSEAGYSNNLSKGVRVNFDKTHPTFYN
jgi:hypothetical protein